MVPALATLLLAQSSLPAKTVKVELPDSAGVARAVPSPGAKATLVIFVGVDCPIANRMAPELARIVNEYEKRGVQSYLVYPDGALTKSQVNEHRINFELTCPGIIDGGHKLVKALGASVTPQAVIVDPKGKVRYLGRVNDLYEEHGKIRSKPSRNDLRIALDEFLGGREITRPVTQAVGCFIGG